MAKLVIVKGDPVTGKDKHAVAGFGPNPSPPPQELKYAGTADFAYIGTISARLSDFVSINGTPVALVTSQSSLNAGETVMGGKHYGPAGDNYKADPASPALEPTKDARLEIKDGLDPGVPNSGAGSQLLTIGGVKVLLDADKLDTCGSKHQSANSSVAAQGQDFVRCGS
ncbi:hypothetical protein [Kutzneria chonburiensis]|uniref:Uncharacterized protein n=1 Tax=Kutzneria chonburiensis TaxID=1483604 RepID=A0ABV6MMI3_9PSEU|nr:hypothetical protein [Kutzneria chonburiensis]